MPTATIRLKLGPKAKDYVKIMGRGERYKRGRVSFKAVNDSIEIKIAADDPVALLASVSGVVKQLRVIRGIDSLMEGTSISRKRT